MSNKLKLTLFGLLLLQFGVLTWSYFGNKQEAEQYYQAIGQFLENPEEVKSLDLSDMNLREMPKEILQFQHLITLNLSHNKFKTIPSEIYELRNLKTVNLSYNRLQEIKLQNNYSIERLDLSHNRIDYVDYHPCSVSCLKALRTINFSHNNLEECPPFNNNSSIDTILLSNNQLNSFYNIHMSVPQYIDYLDISDNEIEGIDEKLYEFIGFDYNELITLANKCESINLSDNYFEYFPYDLFKSETPSSIIMQNGEYETIDNERPTASIYYNHTFLDFSNTNDYLDNFPFNDFINLETLHLENTRFEDFLVKLPYLSELNIKGISVNGFLDIRCPNLERLEIDYNLISNFTDDELLKTPYLKTIVIANYQDNKILIARLEMFYPDVRIILE